MVKNRNLSKQNAPTNITNIEKNLDKKDFIISKTDTKGKIIYCNEIFAKVVGYNTADLMGANHNLIRHPDMPKIAFKLAWDLIKDKKEFFGFVKNLCSDGSYYWVFACITADLDINGNIISYTSVRRKAPKDAIDKITPIYKLLVDNEKQGGVESSLKFLNNFLYENNTTYDKFILSLQNNHKV